MNRWSPVYTTEAECQDCFKCVRNCPAKAIRIHDAHAEVIPELCVACGTCLTVCPVHAKHVRDDTGQVREALRSGAELHVSLAPSWSGSFPELTVPGMCALLRDLGFAGVSETAVGAQHVSRAVAEVVKNPHNKVEISSACPAVKEFVRRFFPAWVKHISPLPSPLQEHCRIIRRTFGEQAQVVFFGPCVAKKLEAAYHPELIFAALGFTDLRRMIKKQGLDLKDYAAVPESSACFELPAAEEGALYPAEGGMLESLRGYDGLPKAGGIAVSGLDNLRKILTASKPEDIHGPLFIEALACFGGCVNGPCMTSELSLFERMAKVRREARVAQKKVERERAAALETVRPLKPYEREPAEEEILQALARVGKTRPEDELNCGGCGYDSCRHFARALALGKAEPSMCVSYMRKLAAKKANALLKSMPCGVAIIGADLRIVECNAAFVELLDEGAKLAFAARPGLAGANLYKLLPIGDLFAEAFKSGREVKRAHCRLNGRLIDIAIFTIEAGRIIGATFADVTGMELRRDQIARRAREVLTKNLATVQDIAWKLGEHMASTEVLLRSIADGFSVREDQGTWTMSGVSETVTAPEGKK